MIIIWIIGIFLLSIFSGIYLKNNREINNGTGVILGFLIISLSSILSFPICYYFDFKNYLYGQLISLIITPITFIILLSIICYLFNNEK